VRCRPLEDHLAVVERHCKFRQYGCEETVRYTQARAHEDSCPFDVFQCPVNGCGYLGNGAALFQHVPDHDAAEVDSNDYLRFTPVTVSKAAPFRVLVLPGRRLVYLLLVGGDVLGGRCLSLVCLGRRPEEGAEIRYTLMVHGRELGSLLMLTATAPCVRSLDGFRAKKFLFVPDNEWASSGSLSVNVRIGWHRPL
jgi:E3 ubiquitin-protein ligase SIAH1